MKLGYTFTSCFKEVLNPLGFQYGEFLNLSHSKQTEIQTWNTFEFSNLDQDLVTMQKTGWRDQLEPEQYRPTNRVFHAPPIGAVANQKMLDYRCFLKIKPIKMKAQELVGN